MSTENTQNAEIQSLEDLQKVASNGVDSQNAAANSEEAALPAYTPNFKYVAGGQEKEFPEYLRGIVKDAESEKTIRELMSKADGLPLVKQRAESLEKQIKEYLPESQTYRKIKGYLEKGDIGALVSRGLVSDETLLKYAVARAQYYKQFSPEQRAIHDQKTQLELEKEQLQEQLAMQQQYSNEAVMSSFENDLQTKYGEWTKAYPKFKDTVLLIAKDHFEKTGTDLHHEQYIKMAQEYFNGQLPQAAVQVQQPPAQTKTVAQQRREVATLPNVNSNGNSAIGKPIESLDDLRKLRDTKFARNS
jgi:hypothetical protein